MDKAQVEKISRFMSDKIMSEAVHEVLLHSFMKPKPIDDVRFLAASRIALDLLEDAWRDLRSYKDTEPTGARSGNVGL